MVLNRIVNIKIGAYSPLATQKLENIITQDVQEIVVSNFISNEWGDFGISVGSLNLEKILCTDELKFGEANASKFEVEIFSRTRTEFPDVSGREITVTVEDIIEGETIEKQLFIGIVDSATTDKFNLNRKIVAYDKLYYLRDTNVADTWSAYWQDIASTGEVATLKSWAHYLYESLGIEHEEVSLISDNMLIRKYNEFTSITFGDMLAMINEVQCCFPHIDGFGVLRFVTLETLNTQYEVTDYEQVNSSFDNYITKDITGINIYASSEELSQWYPLETSGDNAYPISGNIFLLSLTADELNDRCNIIYENIKNIRYTPCEIIMNKSNLNYSLGDYVNTTRGNHYVMSQVFSGSLFVEHTVKCVAVGESLNQDIPTKNNTIIEGKKYSTVEQNIDMIRTSVGNIQDTIGGMQSDISEVIQTAKDIQVNFVRKDEKAYVDLTTNITFDVTGINIQGQNQTTGETSSLHLGSDEVTIRDSDNNEVASMQANEFRTSEWLMTQTKNNTIFNIFRRH